MLTVEELAFGYPGHAVGRDVSLRLEPGEVLCLLGPNGGGKTTLFKTMLGLLRPQGGRVTIDGQDIAALGPRRMAQLVGYVPQAHAGYFPFLVADMVLMGRTAHVGLFAAPSACDRAIAGEATATMGIAALAEQVYTRISGGERQLALIARALAQQARILVMDEP
ncbi:MAG: ABC transporter ATP-binding protein, partial [Alphaproteobacteria bacterium]|nr:ABC transporter ATP-binding protein [Alphaproteobacteria bacterium]